MIPHGSQVDAQHEKFDWRPPDEFGAWICGTYRAGGIRSPTRMFYRDMAGLGGGFK